MDLPRIYSIRERSHRILNPFTAQKLATLGEAIRLAPGATMLDLCCGKGEMLSTWARDHAITGTGVDISTVFLRSAQERAAQLGVTHRVSFIHGDASAYVAGEPVDVAACIGATWIGDGVAGTAALLQRSLRPGGLMLIGEPFWRAEPLDQEFGTLPALMTQFGDLGYDVVEMVLADEDSWDRYEAAKWLNLRAFLDASPQDELAPQVRQELAEGPLKYVQSRRHHLGWGVFVLMKR